VSFIPHLCTIRAHRKETVRSRLQVVHSGSERRQKINLRISTWVDRALTLPRSSTSATRSARGPRPVWRAATACDHYHDPCSVHDGRAADPDVPAAALADGEDVRESAAAAPLLSVVGGKMGVTLYRPATFLHMRGMISRQSASWRNLDHRRSVADQRALRLGRHAACRVTATPRRARLHPLIVEFACEDVRDARLSGRSASRASMSAIPRNLPGNTGFPPAAAGGNGITFRLRGPPHW
jgi:hypothetical protein